MKTLVLSIIAAFALSGCSGSLSPRVCVDTTMLPQIPGVKYPEQDKDAPTQRCGGFALGVSLGDRG